MPKRDVEKLISTAAQDARVWASILNDNYDEAQNLANENLRPSQVKVSLDESDKSKMKTLDKSSLSTFATEARKKGVSL
jgi:hypothetical protein